MQELRRTMSQSMWSKNIVESSFIVNFATQFSTDVTHIESTSRKSIIFSTSQILIIFQVFGAYLYKICHNILYSCLLYLILVLLVLQDYVKSKAHSGRGLDGSVIWLCTECDYQHKKNSNVFRHIQRKHLTNCILCGMIFQSAGELREHKNICHRPW